MPLEGTVKSLGIAVSKLSPMDQVDKIELITGQGIVGDRHLRTDGTRSKRQILLMDIETLIEFGLSERDIKENITVQGIDFSLIKLGNTVRIGMDVVLEITGDCEPCSRMDELRSGLKNAIDGRRGMLAYVKSGGTISSGDSITVES
ncbi:MAG: hypothetical protein FI688_03115 [SAR202 cluster bacterium]|nr:hypothetical protein [SAR202 cluster bacterium]|tara:strand:- start:9218 stop:9658 length:441 start_codon:yes stop_codon:yes gene_type:complete